MERGMADALGLLAYTWKVFWIFRERHYDA
jgi:hypothetical protein